MSDPSLRLRGLAQRSLAGYRSGETSLRRLVDDLDVVWNGLSPSDWRVEFRGHWWTLEQIYSAALDRGELDALSPEFLAAIDESVVSLERLLETWPGAEE
jgi:hypothetical protein